MAILVLEHTTRIRVWDRRVSLLTVQQGYPEDEIALFLETKIGELLSQCARQFPGLTFIEDEP